MKYARSGFILFCKNYEACCSFYRDILELPTLFAIDDPNEPIHCFGFGSSYLMVERDENAKTNLNKLRLNVDSIDEAKQSLEEKNIPFEENISPWGTVLLVVDPDGNITSIRDEETFAKQIQR